MKKILININIILIFACGTGYADTHYVSRDGTNDSATGYITWSGAATQFQWAVDAAVASDTVLVSNGVYDTGGAVTPGGWSLTNRVVITKAITVRSANNDPTTTIIKGKPDDVTGTCGTNAVRCVYINSSGASLIGFTLTDGHTMQTGSGDGIYYERSGGGVFLNAAGTVISNCLILRNKASYRGGGAFGGVLYNCTLTANAADASCGGTESAAWKGGGISGGTLNDCMVNCNTSKWGAVYYSGGGTMNRCTLSNNVATGSGGGGGLFVESGSPTVNNCLLVANRTLTSDGGGVYLFGGSPLMKNCLLVGNVSGNLGGNAFFNGCGTMNNCTLVAGSALGGGGVRMTDGGALTNCIVWGNTNSDFYITRQSKVLGGLPAIKGWHPALVIPCSG